MILLCYLINEDFIEKGGFDIEKIIFRIKKRIKMIIFIIYLVVFFK